MKTVHQLAFVSLIALASCSHKTETTTAENNQAFNVQVEKPTTYNGQIESSYSGVVEAQKTTALSFAQMGTVTEILVDEGQAIHKGQLLAKVNTSIAQDAYQITLAKQQQAEDAYRRMKPMKENGTLPEIKWVEVETGVAQAKAAVAMAQKNISDCNLYAPESGVIGRKLVQVGMNIIPGTTVLELLNIGTVFVKIPVSENEVNLFQKGEIAQIRINALNQNVTGTVKEIGVAADILSHSYPVKIEVNNAKNEIKPGMVCSVQASAQDNRSGVLISNKALQENVNGSQFVFVENQGKAAKKQVKTIALLDNKVLVQGDISVDDNVIVSGQQKLSEGSPVKTDK